MSHTWTEIKPKSSIIPDKRSKVSYTLYNNKILVYGGFHAHGWDQIYYDDMYEFDLATKKWSLIEQVGKKPAPRWGNTTIVYQNKLIVFGGRQSGSNNPAIHQFDLKKRIWEVLKTKGKYESLYYHASVLYQNRYMISIGGLEKNDKYNQKIYVLDLEKSKWNTMKTSGKKLSPRFGLSAVIDNDDIYVVGGYKKDTLSGLFKLNLRSKIWSQIVSINDEYWTLKESHSAVLDSKSKKMIIFGGFQRKNNSNLNNITIFNLVTEQWEEVKTKGVIPDPRDDHSAILSNNKMYIFFGTSGNNKNFYNDIFEFQFASELSIHMHSFLDNQQLCDIEFTTLDKKRIQAHNHILQARLKHHWTPFFQNQLSNLTYEELRSFLTFIYTGNLETEKEETTNKLKEMVSKLNLENLQIEGEENEKKLETDLNELFEDEKTKDFSIIVKRENEKEEIIRVHKTILSAHSELFRGMFLSVHDNSNSAPDLSGRSAKSIRKLIQYFYTGKTSQIDSFEIAVELLDAPSYYGIDSSRLEIPNQCAQIINQNLNIQNVVEFCYSSLELGNVLLQDFCIEFIKNNFKQLKSQNLDDLFDLINEIRRINLREMLK
ncbi:leucine-zipper-like transcriptional regulator 1 [Anaeramoeba ignava]|uniref:Leucine-zipper-like transcriptional regulator 1 n=1 Tax=Anaeramoeba ignava TaxID=1746090 RepID=A0A9Q0LUZ0_ANAIG|nr:leucine-zipper-like transcriptional regulator 1 [Anaeramoeba ignava]